MDANKLANMHEFKLCENSEDSIIHLCKRTAQIISYAEDATYITCLLIFAQLTLASIFVKL